MILNLDLKMVVIVDMWSLFRGLTFFFHLEPAYNKPQNIVSLKKLIENNLNTEFSDLKSYFIDILDQFFSFEYTKKRK